jgi:hypothetical protein
MMGMMRLIAALLVVAAGMGCATATRLSMRPEEERYKYMVAHSQSAQEAFSKTELALAEAYNDLPAVLKLKQAESGTFVLKPLVSYQVGGTMGQMRHANYSLKVVVLEGSVTMEFEVGSDVDGFYPPETEMAGIRARFGAIAEAVARSVGGTVRDG